MSDTNTPIQTLRDGNIQLAIWENVSENGPFYSTTISRSYKDGEGTYKNTKSYSGLDLLKIGQLAGHAYMVIKELERQSRQERAAA